MKKIKEKTLVFAFGSIIYSITEILFRGYTHWTMTITGGIVFTILYTVNINLNSESLFSRCVIGSIIITIIEFIIGCIVNIGLKMNVWDYSKFRFNLLGQICPRFSFFWFLISIPSVILSFLLKMRFFGGTSKRICWLKSREIFPKQ